MVDEIEDSNEVGEVQYDSASAEEITKELIMAKAFKDYTIEDLYRLNFSFLVQSIKDKELAEEGVSEEVFIKSQKLALMFIFNELSDRRIDSNEQTIEPFLQGRRLVTNITQIQKIANEIKELIEIPVTKIEYDIPTEFSTHVTDINRNIALVSNQYLSNIQSAREMLASNIRSIEAKNTEILAFSRNIAINKEEIRKNMILLANDKLKTGATTEDKVKEILFYLDKYGFKVVAFYRSGSTIVVRTYKKCTLQLQDPENPSKYYTALLPLQVTFQFDKSGYYVFSDRNFHNTVCRNRVSEYPHPHVTNDSSGTFCTGNASGVLRRITEGGIYNNIETLIRIYSELCDGYNPDSPYRILQEVFLGANAGALIGFRTRAGSGGLSEIRESLKDDGYFKTMIERGGRAIAENNDSKVNPQLFAAFWLDYFESLRSSIDPRLFEILENTDRMSLNTPYTDYWTDSAQLSNEIYKDYLIGVLKLFTKQATLEQLIGVTNESNEESEEVDY